MSNILNQSSVHAALARRQQRLIIYEELRAIHIPMIMLYFLLGYRQAYMLLNRKWRLRPWLRGLLKKLPVLPLTQEPPVYLRANPAGDRAFEIVEKIYKDCFCDDWRIGHVIRFFKSDDLHLAFEKALLLELETFYYYNLLLCRIAESVCPEGRASFVPADANVARIYNACLRIACEYDDSVGDTRGVQFHFWPRFVAGVKDVLYRIALVGYWCFWLARGALRGGKNGPAREDFKFAITIMSPLREFSNDVSGVGFLLDGKGVRKDNCIFVSPVPLGPEEQLRMRQGGLRLTVLDRFGFGRDECGLHRMTKTVLGLAVSGPTWMLRTALVGLREANRWVSLMRKYSFNHLVTYCDFGIEHVARNVVLRDAGVKTWYYMDTSNHYHAFCGRYKPLHRVAYWGFLLYDYYVSWNRMNTEYNRLHKQSIGRYVEVGVLWAELIRGLRCGEVLSNALDDLRERLLPLVKGDQKIVAVFDSTYNNNTITGFQQGIAFVRGIQRLLDERDDIFVIFKEKKDPWIYPHLGWDTMGLEEEYRRLGADQRCFMAGFRESQAAVIALADVTVSFPFTSTTLEAIGAGCRGIYYDPLGSYMDTAYDEIPGFVVHDFDGLKERVVELLYSVREEDYRSHLERYARERVDGFLDGHALSRFRNLLCEDASQSWSRNVKAGMLGKAAELE